MSSTTFSRKAKARHHTELDIELEKDDANNNLNDEVDSTNDDDIQVATEQMGSPRMKKQITLSNMKGASPSQRRSTYVEVTLQRKDMNSEQRKIYDFVICQIRLITEYFKFLRNAQEYTFIKMIGQGGFGHVWMANDLKTGKVCAVKELHKVDGTQGFPLLRFIREVQTMIASRSRFVLPIVGFTIEIPLSVITPFMANGTLSDLLRKQPPTTTQRTIIALCIAQGMADIHKFGVIHRDLKLSNILMDENGLPLICDFGTSRMYLADKRMSCDIGTVNFMAPEIFQSPNYNQSVDVYSFGMLLYEMSELKQPYRGIKEKEKIEMIIKGERPPFNKDRTPKCLKDLICRCWSADVSERPPFEEIVTLFSLGHVHFKETNLKYVKEFWGKMVEELSTYQPEKPPTSSFCRKKLLLQVKNQIFKNPLFAGDDMNPVTEKDLIVFEQPVVNKQDDIALLVNVTKPPIIRIVENGSNSDDLRDNESNNSIGQYKSPQEILINSNSPQFVKYLKYLSEKLKVNQYLDFFQNTVSYIRGHWPCENMKLIFDTYTSLAKRDPSFLDLFVRSNLFSLLSSKTVKYSFDLLAQLVHHRMDLVGDNEIKLMFVFLEKRPYDAIYIFGEAAMHLRRISKPLAIFDALMKRHQLFLDNQTGAIFLGIFYTLLLRSKSYRAKRIGHLRPIFVNFISTKHREIAYSIICHFYDQYFEIPFEIILNESQNASNSLISLLLRMNYYPIDKNFVHLIVDTIPKNPKALLILVKFVNEGKLQCNLVAKYSKWMNVTEKAHLKWANSVFILIFMNVEVRPILLRAIEFPNFLKNSVESGNKSILVAFNSCLKKAKCDQHLITSLTLCDFFKSLVNVAKQPEDSNIAVICLMIVQTMTSYGISNDYELFVPIAKNFLLNDSVEDDLFSKKAAIQLLCSLSGIKEISSFVFKNSEIVDFFNNLNSPEYLKYKMIFKANTPKEQIP